jgi:HlyD family secretion protein
VIKPDVKPEAKDLDELLGTAGKAPGGGILSGKMIFMAIVLVASALAYLFWPGSAGTDAPIYQTKPVTRGDITTHVTATGTVEPTNVVDVSSELSGIVRAVLVDYNDRVSKGQELARLDMDKLEAQVAHSNATVAAKQAMVAQAEASVEEAQKKLARLKTLARKKITSQQDLEAAEATYNRSLAELASAKADVKVAGADLQTAETNLAKAHIYSPIDGVVLERDVDPGQTVAASLSAPVLFTIAEDLTNMELQVDIDEADIGAVQVHQTATFTVEAYQGREFPAVIEELRYASETTDGVVTYKGILTVDNKEMLLRPGMTATAEIVVKQVKDGLLIPNAALRWSPPETAAGEDKRSLLDSILPRPPQHRKVAKVEAKDGQRTVYILKDDMPTAVQIRTGATDGGNSLVVEGKLSVGDKVIVDNTTAKR